jgi:tropomodulin
MTDLEKSIKQLREDDYNLVKLNLNNIPISEDQFESLFDALKSNTHLEQLSLSNTGLGDKSGLFLADVLEKNAALRSINIETNNLNPVTLTTLVKSLLSQKYIEEFRASNQRQQTLGNKIEMEITKLVEQNPTILRLGLHLEYNDARNRVATHLQRNLDRRRLKRIGHTK